MTGQTSQVWEAIHDARQQRYAIKMLLPELRKDRDQLVFLKQEFAVAKSLTSRRVIEVLELSRDGDIPYLVMEFFPAPNLKHWIQRGVDILAPHVTSAIRQAGEGLAYFHKQGWVHRDIKPDNFLMSPEGEVKLIDFALAVKEKKGLARLLSGKTKVQGTRSYMSPEQIRGQSLDQRADIYSFGCSAYEMVCGRTPYTGVSSNELLSKHLRQPAPSVEAANQNVTPEFADLLRRTMAKKPEGRPESMGTFLRELQNIKVFKQTPKAAQKTE